jgi:NAD(P)-dependent dehydrogenase (short-subunit alcohol dehydrogenase family)
MIHFNDIKKINVSNKNVVITGANSGIGYETAKYFARHGAQVFLCSRDNDKGELAKHRIKELATDANVHVMTLDLADSSSIDDFANELKKYINHIDVLCNNAGIMGTQYTQTQDGFEYQLGVNHLGHFRLTGLLLELMDGQSRIVNVSSMAYLQGRLDRNNMMFENGKYSPFSSYSRSKLSNVLFTLELARRLETLGSQTKVVCAHPGIAMTGLFNKEKQSNVFAWLIRFFSRYIPSASDGAKAIITACLDKNADQGYFYGPYRSKKHQGDIIKLERINAVASNKDNQAFLWEYSLGKTDINYPL